MNQTAEIQRKRKMHVGAWFNAAISFVIGVLPGSFVYPLVLALPELDTATVDFPS